MPRSFNISGIKKKHSVRILLTLLFTALYLGSIVTSTYSNPTNSTVEAGNITFQPTASREPIENPTPENIGSGINGLGSITIHSLTYIGDINGDEEPGYFPLTLESGITYANEIPKFLNVSQKASTASAIKIADTFSSEVVIELEETVTWEYDNTITENIIGFAPYLQTASLTRMQVNTTEIDLEANEDYWTATELGDEVFYYNFTSEFEANDMGQLEITYTYEFSVPITQWTVETLTSEEDQYITAKGQTLSQNYLYSVTLGAIGLDLPLSGRINITAPDSDVIYDLELSTFDSDSWDIVDHTILDNMVSLRTNFTSGKTLNLTFSADFTVDFLDSIEDFWAEDKLIENFDKRQRVYQISVTEGPAELLLKGVKFNETSIYYPEIDSSFDITSALDRPVFIENMNKSTGFEDDEAPLENPYVDGISLLGYAISGNYYIATGELDLITIRYSADLTLDILVTDNIKTPLKNYLVNLYVGDSLYGTKISIEDTNPLASQKTDQNGLISLPYVPRMEYTAQVMDLRGNEVGTFTVSPGNELNTIVTEITHFPITLLGFGSVSIAFILIGFLIFKRNQ